MSDTADPREPLARLVHQVRLECEAERAAAEGRPTFVLGAYEDRSEHQRELDMRIGAAVAAAAAAGAEAKLAEVRRTVSTFLEHYGHSELPSFKVAIDLANSIRKALEREISSEEESRD